MATLQQLKVVHERQRDVLNTYHDLKVNIQSLQVREWDSQAYLTWTDQQCQVFSFSESSSCLQRQPSSFHAHIDVGGGVMMQAEVPSTSVVFVDVGLGFKAECTLEDALRIAVLRQTEAQVLFKSSTYTQLLLFPGALLPNVRPGISIQNVKECRAIMQERMNMCAMQSISIHSALQKIANKGKTAG